MTEPLGSRVIIFLGKASAVYIAFFVVFVVTRLVMP